MTRRTIPVLFSAAILLAAADCGFVQAQGLIFSLPEDGTGVEYQGTLVQENERPDLPDNKEVLKWTKELSIKSVGREDADYAGVVQPCRWIEIKVVTGAAGAGGIDSGPVGARIYKVLVPESKVIGSSVDSQTIPNTVMPIVKGYRRLGEEPVEELNGRGLVVYPTLCLLANYRNPETITASDRVENASGQDSFDARHMKGTVVRERPDARSTNTGEFWVSRDVPFGLAGWTVTVRREAKVTTEIRDRFQLVSTVTCQMKVKKLLDTAETELVTD